MGPEIGDYVARELFRWAVILFLLGGALATALIFGIPWLWGLIKPFLHSVTA